jgi:lambda family phage portal protein
MFEAVVRALAPAWALRRQQSRMAMQALDAMEARLRYDGARATRRTRGWNAPPTSANVETRADLRTLRARSRDLIRNNPYASAGLDILVSYQVGTGITAQSQTGDAALDRQANDLWEAWGRHADATGRHDINALMAQVARTRAESGEALVLLRTLPGPEWRSRGTPVPLVLHVMEPDHLDGLAGILPSSGIEQGVELDSHGRPIAYHIQFDHPGDTFASSNIFRIPAEAMLHIYRQDRPGQVRGVPDLAPVMTRLRMLDEYEDAALMQALSQACVAAFVTSSADAGTGPLEAPPSGDTSGLKSLSPGMVERLLPGESVEFLTPTGSGPFAEFARHQLRAIAAGFGLTYDLLTGDLSQANYSSLRAGRLAFRRRLEAAQWLLLIPRFCQPVWDAFIAAAQSVGALPPRPGPWPVEWSPPRFEMVDPLKDTMAIRLQLRLGLMTWGQAVAEMGWDAKRQAASLAEWNATFDELGLILDGDARRTGGTGAAQDAAQNAAIEIAATGAALPQGDSNAG